MLQNFQDRIPLVKALWFLISIVFLVTMLYVTLPNIRTGINIDLAIVEGESISILSLPYPTLTVCAVQHPDRWNFPRLVMNQLSDDVNLGLGMGIKKLHSQLLRDLLDQRWLPLEYHRSLQGSQEEIRRLQDVLEVLLMSRSRQVLDKELQREILSDQGLQLDGLQERIVKQEEEWAVFFNMTYRPTGKHASAICL